MTWVLPLFFKEQPNFKRLKWYPICQGTTKGLPKMCQFKITPGHFAPLRMLETTTLVSNGKKTTSMAWPTFSSGETKWLVGGWTNQPIWKIFVKLDHDRPPQGSGWKIKNVWNHHHLEMMFLYPALSYLFCLEWKIVRFLLRGESWCKFWEKIMSLHQGEKTCIHFYPEIILFRAFFGWQRCWKKTIFSPIQRTGIPLQQVRAGHRKHI